MSKFEAGDMVIRARGEGNLDIWPIGTIKQVVISDVDSEGAFMDVDRSAEYYAYIQDWSLYIENLSNV